MHEGERRQQPCRMPMAKFIVIYWNRDRARVPSVQKFATLRILLSFSRFPFGEHTSVFRLSIENIDTFAHCASDSAFLKCMSSQSCADFDSPSCAGHVNMPRIGSRRVLPSPTCNNQCADVSARSHRPALPLSRRTNEHRYDLTSGSNKIHRQTIAQRSKYAVRTLNADVVVAIVVVRISNMVSNELKTYFISIKSILTGFITILCVSSIAIERNVSLFVRPKASHCRRRPFGSFQLIFVSITNAEQKISIHN